MTFQSMQQVLKRNQTRHVSAIDMPDTATMLSIRKPMQVVFVQQSAQDVWIFAERCQFGWQKSIESKLPFW